MKILVLNFEYPPLGGGASPICEKITVAMATKGHDMTVVTMGYQDLPYETVEKKVRIFRLPCGRKSASMSYPMEHLRFLKVGRKFLRNHLAKETYDIIHCHFIISTGILAKWVYKKFGIPYIITPHGSDLPKYNPDRFQLIHYATPGIIRNVLKDCSAVTCSSGFLASLIRPFLREGEKDKLLVIPNGIEYKPNLTKVKKRKILSTGRLLKRKGFHSLIEAFGSIESEYELHICGEGPEMNELQTLAQKYPEAQIIFHGWMDNTSEAYHQLLKDAAIFSLVSEYENASLSILEALSHSCAVITSDYSGTAEMVGDAGILLPAYDTEALTKTLRNLMDNEEKISQWGKKAHERFVERFSLDKIFNDYENLLQESSQVTANS